ncbi:hypothetical protein Eta_0037 [Serratia phage Eta]|uniref:Uncharacterized protein n=1 Tax=Serratia phage Eta TaxID=1282995 RepID=R9VWD0_9CAUD|nr:hypothetical protein Eta_0037 [Serratia phage Eta]AGN89483.1 hypothetical protein Eta_0037 [Serratia phage Eta]
MRWLILYLAFGGVLMALVAGGLKKDCGAETSVTEFALSSAMWPAMIAGAITYRINFGASYPSNVCAEISDK